MATTTNFGWETPDDTDLVKDGAAAIRTALNGVDTSFVDLKGGTTGQILSKATNADLDYVWINNDQGDITGVTAGTGISGGGTSGTVTVTNSMATAIDAKGDLIGGTGADAFARLAVGANGTVLTADSAETTGMKWATPSGSSGPAFSAYRTGTQTTSNNVWTKMQIQTEVYDTDNCYDNSTNYRFTPNKAGKYYVTYQAFIGGPGVYAGIYKNGSEVARTQQGQPNPGTVLIEFNGSTDYIEFYAMTPSNGGVEGGAYYTYVQAVWIRS